MTHGEGWQFIQAGRYLERACAVSRWWACTSSNFSRRRTKSRRGSDHLEWIGLLRCCTAFEAYCKVYTADVKPERIAEFLVSASEFPHSIRFSADALETAIKEIQEAAIAPAARVSASRDACAPRWASARSTRSWPADCTPILSCCASAGRSINALYQTYISYPIEAALEA